MEKPDLFQYCCQYQPCHCKFTRHRQFRVMTFTSLLLVLLVLCGPVCSEHLPASSSGGTQQNSNPSDNMPPSQQSKNDNDNVKTQNPPVSSDSPVVNQNPGHVEIAAEHLTQSEIVGSSKNDDEQSGVVDTIVETEHLTEGVQSDVHSVILESDAELKRQQQLEADAEMRRQQQLEADAAAERQLEERKQWHARMMEDELRRQQFERLKEEANQRLESEKQMLRQQELDEQQGSTDAVEESHLHGAEVLGDASNSDTSSVSDAEVNDEDEDDVFRDHFPDLFTFVQVDMANVDSIAKNQLSKDVLETVVTYKPDAAGRVLKQHYTQIRGSDGRIGLDFHEMHITADQAKELRTGRVVVDEEVQRRAMDGTLPPANSPAGFRDGDTVADTSGGTTEEKEEMTEEEKRAQMLYETAMSTINATSTKKKKVPTATLR